MAEMAREKPDFYNLKKAPTHSAYKRTKPLLNAVFSLPPSFRLICPRGFTFTRL